MKIEAYCVKCKAKREVTNPARISMKNGRFAAKGTCSVCGTSVFKILSKECSDQMAASTETTETVETTETAPPAGDATPQS